MLIQSARPQTFSQVAGQKIPKALLTSIVKNPKTSPKSIILCGPFGTGKTTQARIFARAINCEHPHSNGDPCGKCQVCNSKLDESPYYTEYDASQLKLDNVRNLADTWFSTLKNGYRVIVFDECHLLSSQVQSALLKSIEEPPVNTFFLFCTTDVEKVLNTIRSRSLEIKLSQVPSDEMKPNLVEVAQKNGITVDDEVLDRIIRVSKGHMRNAHMELDKYAMIGKEMYLDLFKSSYDAIDKFFIAVAQKNRDSCFKAIDEIIQYPLVTVKDDFETYILDLTKSLILEPNKLVKLLGSNTLKLIKLTMADWFKECFSSDVELQTGLLCIYQIMMDSQSQQRQVQTNINARR